MLNFFKILIVLFVAILAVNSEEANTFPDGRIVGGRLVSILKHPHQCSLRYKSCTQCDFSHLCGCSIYKHDVLITAAHCVRGREAKNFATVCATENRRGADGVIVPVKDTIMNEGYDPILTDNDVALLILQTSLPIDNVTIAAIQLATEYPAHGAKSYVTGWGTTTEGGLSSNKLLEVQVPIVDQARCDDAYGPGRISEAMLCAGAAEGGKDACQGDSGGPLVVDRLLAGIVSWGRGCARPDYPGVYVNVAHFNDWINENTLKHSSN